MLSLRDGDFSVRMPADLTGVDGKIADAFNDIAAVSERRSRETSRVTHAVGKAGKLKQRMNVAGLTGGWASEVDAINTLIDDLVWPTTEVTRAVGAVAKGDLGQSMALEVDGRPLEGEFLRSAKLVNNMIDQLSVFTSEVTRVAREVGTEGKLGGQAQVKGVSGVWKELTESVNQMAGNLTAQVRNIADVTIAVANGDLSKTITVDVRGEILQLKEAINTMVGQLRPQEGHQPAHSDAVAAARHEPEVVRPARRLLDGQVQHEHHRARPVRRAEGRRHRRQHAVAAHHHCNCRHQEPARRRRADAAQPYA
jgi:HAMP domain-containing protein